MDTNLKALKDLYVSMGGAESDVADLTASSEVIPLIKNVAGGGGAGTAVPFLYITENDIPGELIENMFFGENGAPPLIKAGNDQSYFAMLLSSASSGEGRPDAEYSTSEVHQVGTSGTGYTLRGASIVHQRDINIYFDSTDDEGEWARRMSFFYTYDPSDNTYKYNQ